MNAHPPPLQNPSRKPKSKTQDRPLVVWTLGVGRQLGVAGLWSCGVDISHLRTSVRSLDTTAGSLASKASTWASELPAPRLKRIEFCVRCEGSPIARSTCEG